jgi:hypothetical protein
LRKIEEIEFGGDAAGSLRGRSNRMRRALMLGLTFALVCVGWVGAAQAQSSKTDFALLDEPGGGDTNVICRCANPQGDPTSCQIKVTMGNRSDQGGANGFVRVTYNDLDSVDYPIQAGTTLNITMAAGGSNPDKAIKVSGDGTGGSVLVGQMSADGQTAVRCCTSQTSDCQIFPVP